MFCFWCQWNCRIWNVISHFTLVLQLCTSPVQNKSPSKTGSTLVHCFYSFTAPFLSSNFGSFSCLLMLYICLTQHVTLLLAKKPKSIQFLKRNSQNTMLSMALAKSLASYKLKLHAWQALFHTSTSEPLHWTETVKHNFCELLYVYMCRQATYNSCHHFIASSFSICCFSSQV